MNMVTSLGPRGTNIHILAGRSKYALRNLCVSVQNYDMEVNDSSNNFGKKYKQQQKKWRVHILHTLEFTFNQKILVITRVME